MHVFAMIDKEISFNMWFYFPYYEISFLFAATLLLNFMHLVAHPVGTSTPIRMNSIFLSKNAIMELSFAKLIMRNLP